MHTVSLVSLLLLLTGPQASGLKGTTVLVYVLCYDDFSCEAGQIFFGHFSWYVQDPSNNNRPSYVAIN